MLKFKKLLASVLAVTSIFCIVACADVSTDNTTATTATTSGYTTIGPQIHPFLEDVYVEKTVKNAPVILHVKFTEYEILETQNPKIYDLMWNCEVKDVLKGNLPEGTKEVEILDVCMTTETPAVGAEYIAILEGEEVFVFTTEFSLRPISEKEKIKGYID